MPIGTHCDNIALGVKLYAWDDRKDRKLRADRGIAFEEILEAIASGGLLDVLDHPRPERYEGQRVFVVRCHEYVYLVPFVESDEEIFLKTIIPSRKATKTYGGRK
jgi:uncharacterized DUF497 family protein